MDPARALADLTEISTQIRSAVLVESDGTVLASTLEDDARSREMAAAARSLLEAAESERREQAPACSSSGTRSA
jgi:predicted regulator of Ras-like GTPase activity (Roadblock/LC7/MglB family)